MIIQLHIYVVNSGFCGWPEVELSHTEFFSLFFSQFEADRRAFIITINSFDTELTKDDRYKLYPTCGRLYPDGLASLSRADDYDQVRAVAEYYAVCIIYR